MDKDEKKATETKVDDEKKLTEEELDKASGGSNDASEPIYDWKRCIIGTDKRPYPLVIDPDSDDN